jgi:parallel beta-helix repeat protein
MDRRGAAGLLVVAAFAGVVRSGPLDPPASPSPSMKTLDQVEPRQPISSLPYTIAGAGSYYVTSNLVGIVSQHGIRITTDNVTLDLSGYTLIGVPGSLDGVSVSGVRRNVVIRNGIVRDWGGDGVDAFFTDNGQFENLLATNNGASGIRIGASSTIKGCEGSYNTLNGLESASYSNIVDCVALQNGDNGISAGAGSTVTGCTASKNATDGVHASALGAGLVVTGCVSKENNGDRIEVLAYSLVEGNTADQSGFAGDGAGIHVTGSGNRIEANNVTNNDRGIDIDAASNIVVRNSAYNNGAAGPPNEYSDIIAGNTVGPIVDSSSIAGSSNPHANYVY